MPSLLAKAWEIEAGHKLIVDGVEFGLDTYTPKDGKKTVFSMSAWWSGGAS
jgi:hypothetical protein